jgi:choline dehydrogenase-like flavoprotein
MRRSIAGADWVMDQTLQRNRTVGGTSLTWSGRCAPLDDIDFTVRSWVPHSGWPITRAELDPFFDRAPSYLGTAPQGYDGRLWHRPGEPDIDTSVLRPCFWQYSQDAAHPSEPMRFGRRFLRLSSPNIRMLHHATVRSIKTNEAGTHLDSVLVGNPEGKTTPG